MARSFRAAVTTALSLFFIGAAPAQSPPDVKLFGQLSAISQVQLSPDGRHLACIQSVDGHPTPIIYRTDTLHDTHPVVLPTADWTIDSFVWANSDRLIMVVKKNARFYGDAAMRTWLRAIAVGIDGSNPKVLLNKAKGYSNNPYAADIVSVDLDDPNHAYAALDVPDISSLPPRQSLGHVDKVQYHLNLFKVDVNTGDTETVGRGETDTSMWLMDGHAHVVARIDQGRHPLVEHVLVKSGSEWKEIASFEASGGRGAGILGLNRDGTGLVRFEEMGPARTKGLTQLSMSDGKQTPLFSDQYYDINMPLSEPWTGRIIGASVIADQEKYHYFDPTLQAVQESLDAVFAGSSVLIMSWDAAINKLVVRVTGTRRPPAYYLVDRTTHKADMLGETFPGLDENALGEVEPYPYKSRDGVDIRAYLTLPPGKTAKNLPAVVLPHGGPGERDLMQFSWLAQFLATRGYAVLQPNFRGSAGYGATYKEAGYGQWGRRMQDDVTDGARRLITDGIADPKRICILGASYGGFAALAGAAFTPELYACAAAWAPVTDLKSFLSSRADVYGKDSAEYSTWARIVAGDNGSSDLDAVSPAHNAQRIKCPILLMHGSLDTVVQIEQSEEMESALRSAGKNVAFIRFPGETHYLEKAESRALALQQIEAFLKKNIGN